MKQAFLFFKGVCTLTLAVTLICFTAYGQESGNEDSLQKSQKSKDIEISIDGAFDADKLNQAMKQLDMEMKKLNREIKKLDITFEKEIQNAMKQVQAEKIAAQVQASIEKIDWNKIQKEINESVVAVNKIKMADIKKEMEKAKAEVEKQKIEIKLHPKIDSEKIRAQVQSAMKNAKKSISAAKEEIKNLKEFTDALEKEGLIDKSKPYRVEIKNGELYINDKKQFKETSDKYRKFYRKNNFTINMSGDEDWI